MDSLIFALEIGMYTDVPLTVADALISKSSKNDDDFITFGDNEKSYWSYFVENNKWSLGTCAVLSLLALICHHFGVIPWKNLTQKDVL